MDHGRGHPLVRLGADRERVELSSHVFWPPQPDIALADWAAVSDRADLTYDLIHLNPDGARLMARVIVRAIKS
ncbi:MAG: hypothetical protein ACLPVY_02705 [Acidimicrobiia bacterium]